MNKKNIWAVMILVVSAVILGGFYCYKVWWPQRQAMIGLGLAESTFPWRAYTQEELNKLYPQIKYADVPTRVTPEQTYAKFREALRTNNLEVALNQLSVDSEKYNENKADLTNAYSEKRFTSIYASYSDKILEENKSESIAQYYFNYLENNVQKTHFIDFIKDANGDWKMDSL